MTTAQTDIAVPLPRLAACPLCKEEIRVRKTGELYRHDRDFGPNDALPLDRYGDIVTRCPQSGQPAQELLEPTFARWLWMQSKRRDDAINRFTQFAAFQFRGCTRSPRLTARDVTWSTPEELHGVLHLRQLARTGSTVRNPLTGEECDWMCRDLHHAAEAYGKLVEAAEK